MTATLAVMAFHLLTWQRHLRRHGRSGGVSDRSCPCVSRSMCNGLVLGLIVVREWNDMSGRIWSDLCFQHIGDQSNITSVEKWTVVRPQSSACFCMFSFWLLSMSSVLWLRHLGTTWGYRSSPCSRGIIHFSLFFFYHFLDIADVSLAVTCLLS